VTAVEVEGGGGGVSNWWSWTVCTTGIKTSEIQWPRGTRTRRAVEALLSLPWSNVGKEVMTADIDHEPIATHDNNGRAHLSCILEGHGGSFSLKHTLFENLVLYCATWDYFEAELLTCYLIEPLGDYSLSIPY
jgi:hypothetical protein